MTIAITSSGISLDGPLVAGEKVAVTVSGLSIAAEDKPTLALLARFPDALLASVELAEDAQTPGTWTGELDTATKQTALFFATARADERRDAALELVAGRVSLARLTVPMANSALCPKPDGSPFASPVYVPVPGPPGQGGDPYDQAPQMDGEASAGTADEYARGDHVHPTDTSRAAQADVAAIQDVIPSTATPSNKLATAADVPPAQVQADWTETDPSSKAYILGKPTEMTPTQHGYTTHGAGGSDEIDGSMLYVGGSGAYSSTIIAAAIDDMNTTIGEKANAADLSNVATTGDYADLNNKPTIPSAYGPFTAREEAVTSQTREQTSYGKGGAATSDGNGNTWSSAFPKNSGTLALQEGIAPAFSSSSTYAVGAYCTHEGMLYKCTTAVTTAGAWDSTKWSAVSAMGEMPAPITVDSAMSSTSTNPVQNKVVKAAIDGCVPWGNANKTGLAIGTETSVGTNNGFASGWFSKARGNQSIGVGYYAIATGNQGIALGNQVSAAGNTSIALGWFAVAAGSGNGESTTNPHDYSFCWQGVSSSSQQTFYHSHGAGTFNINPVGGAAGFYVGEDSLASLLRYSFASPTPSVSGTSATVACEDRAINDFTVATGITSLTITPPAAVTGRARDFFCRVTLTDASLPTVTLSGGTIDIGATEVAGMTQGVNLLMFTEISSGHWLASRRSES